MRTTGIRLIRSVSVALALSAVIASLAAPVAAQTAATASPTPAPTSTPMVVAPMPFITPVPIPPHPDVRGHLVCPHGLVCLTYDAGRSALVSCAYQTVCTVLFPGETILQNGIAGVQADTGADPLQAQGLWSVKPFVHDGDSKISISPYANSPRTNITVQTDQHLYVITLQQDVAAQATVYRYLFPDEHNVVTIPQEEPRVYETPTPEPASEEVAPAPCPTSYSVHAQNGPSFWPKTVWIHDDSVTVTFDASTTLPAVGLPMQGDTFPVDLNHLGQAPVDYDAQGHLRSETVTSCYPAIVFFTNDGHGRHAVVLEANQ